MEGPTPVSALIHAATMVTAGVYLLVRMSPVLALSHSGRLTIAIIGGVTAFVAATIATSQKDIKKVLAFSTVSQIGYMVLAVGVGAYAAAIFLMVAHAFFKALLFLGSGSVIHSLNGEQDMRKMGGLAEVPAPHVPDVPRRLAGDLGHPALRRLLRQGRRADQRLRAQQGALGRSASSPRS